MVSVPKVPLSPTKSFGLKSEVVVPIETCQLLFTFNCALADIMAKNIKTKRPSFFIIILVFITIGKCKWAGAYPPAQDDRLFYRVMPP